MIISSRRLSFEIITIWETRSKFRIFAIRFKISSISSKVSSSISKKTDFVIVGDNPGSKLQKGQLLNINILNEKDFIDLLDEIKNKT